MYVCHTVGPATVRSTDWLRLQYVTVISGDMAVRSHTGWFCRHCSRAHARLSTAPLEPWCRRRGASSYQRGPSSRQHRQARRAITQRTGPDRPVGIAGIAGGAVLVQHSGDGEADAGDLSPHTCVRACVHVQRGGDGEADARAPELRLLACLHTHIHARARASARTHARTHTHTHTVARRGGCADGRGDDDNPSASVAGRLGSVRRQLVYQC